MSRPEGGRLARAVHLSVDPLEAGVWRVTGGAEPHQVRAMGGDLDCDCVDASFGQTCKHVLAVRLRLGDEEALEGVRGLVPAKPGRAQGSPPAARRQGESKPARPRPRRVVAVEHGELVCEDGEVWGRRARRDAEGHCVGSEWYQVMPPLPGRDGSP